MAVWAKALGQEGGRHNLRCGWSPGVRARVGSSSVGLYIGDKDSLMSLGNVLFHILNIIKCVKGRLK